MFLSELPDWKLEPVKLVQIDEHTEFPRLIAPRAGEASLAHLEARRAEIDAALSTYGAVLVRGFEIPDEPAFERTARTLSGALESRYGDLVKRKSADFVYDATWYPADRAILFHNEGSHTPTLPMRQLFFCGRDGFTGGETPIVDCRALYKALARELREPFEQKGLLYQRNFIRGVDVSWQDFFRTTDKLEVERRCREQGVSYRWKRDGSLCTETRTPAVIELPGSGEASFCNQVLLHHVACLDTKTRKALQSMLSPEELPRHVFFGDRTPISDEVMAALLQISNQTAARFRWQRGDVLLLDNLSVAHARSPYAGDRQILVAIGNVVSRHQISNLREVNHELGQ